MWPEKIEEYWNKASRMHVAYTRRMYTGMFGPLKTDEFKAICEAAEKIVSDVLKNETPEETARQIKIFKREVYGNKADEIILDDLIDSKVLERIEDGTLDK